MSKADASQNQPYRVLARKYRPQNFDELVGQDALVRTLKNAIESGRVAHAFMLTGVRGVGKTTTARIIAKALNYTGADGKAGPTTSNTEDCPLCQAIAEDRHPDVLEMDAASRTGVDDIRELLDGVRYAPSEARYKIYIIDEVHMLSKNAFNALLKTLEEPPSHVKFIFATTEIRKVPVTVLSRCQRFDLNRVDVETLSKHYQYVCDQEGVKIAPEALTMIARGADGSVRDGLSLLDQAIALSGNEITTAQVKDMLGLADRARIMDLVEHTLAGETPKALEVMTELYRAGAAAETLLSDMLDVIHILTRLKAVPDLDTGLAPDESARAQTLAEKTSMPSLGKSWQIILKGMSEVKTAPNPQNAAEMVVIRLIYAANLPDPVKLIEDLQNSETTQAKPLTQKKTKNLEQIDTQPSAATYDPAPPSPAYSAQSTPYTPAATAQSLPSSKPIQAKKDNAAPHIDTLADIVSALDIAGEPLLSSHVYQFMRLCALVHTDTVSKLEIQILEQAPRDLTQKLQKALSHITNKRWVISISTHISQSATLAERDEATRKADFAAVRALPVIQAILKTFPNAKLKKILTK
jgi:DNA polymerase-3 subunit gamma/tau